MKIGIMTFWESQNNYGQLLQAYALQTYLEKEGHDAFLIKYKRIPPVVKKGILDKLINFRLKRFITNRRNRSRILFEAKLKPRKFDLFKQNHLKFSEIIYSSIEELKTSPPEADAYICGSDQVWNNSFPVSCEAFLLGFGDKCTKRLSYAASFGKKELDPETILLFKNHISNFDGISVREKSGLEICTKLGCHNSVWVPDPTLLFNKDEWCTFLDIKQNEQPKGNNIFLYTLGNSNIKDRKLYINYINSLPNSSLVHVSANNDYSGTHFPTIQEWLRQINESDFVITNSFHGVVFSIIFQKNFIVLPNTGTALGMNERIDSLLSKFEIKDRISYKYDSFYIDKMKNECIDWNNINLIMENWKNDARMFLNKELYN